MADLVYRLVVKDDGSAVVENFGKKVKETTDEASKSTDSFGSSMVASGAKAAAYALALKFVYSAAKACVESFIEAERQVASLNAAIRTTQTNAINTSDKLQKLAESMARTNAMSKESVIAIEAMLIRFGVQENMLARATAATIDYSAAMGKDAQSSAFILARAMDGTIESLKRYGIELDTKTIPKSKLAEEVLKAFEARFAGTGKIISDTTSGQIKRAGEEFSNLKEEIGKTISGMIDLPSASKTVGAVFYGLSESIKSVREEAEFALSYLQALGEGRFVSPGTIDKELQAAKEAKLVAEMLPTSTQGLLATAKANKQLIKEIETPGVVPGESGMRSPTGEVRPYEQLLTQQGWTAAMLADETLVSSDIIRSSIADELLAFGELARTTDDAIAVEAKRQEFIRNTPAIIKAARQAELATTGQFFGAMANLAATGGDKMFNISKGFRVAEAIIAGVQATQEALASPPGPPYTFPLAAIVAATAAANVATILSTKPGGGGSISAGGGGGGGGPAPAITTFEPPEIGATGGGMNVNISVAGFVGDESLLASELGKVFREATGDGVEFGMATSRR